MNLVCLILKSSCAVLCMSHWNLINPINQADTKYYRLMESCVRKKCSMQQHAINITGNAIKSILIPCIEDYIW